ncbi:MAG: hypothetical protein R2741_13300 [Methanolobus sp.]
MKAKILLLFLILLSFSVIGCVDEQTDATNETDIVNESINDTADETVVNDTTNETVTDVIVVEEDETEEEPLEVVEYEGARTYTIYMENFLTQPANLTINEGDSVMWFNRNEPTRIFTLVSNEGLWENASIGKRLSFTYTFTEPGTYTYKVLGWDERMKGTITVK